MLLISAQILDSFWKLQSLRKLDKGIDINPEDETTYTTQYYEAFLKYVVNECCAKHRQLPNIEPESIPSNNLIPSATASWSAQSSLDPYHLSSDVEEYLTPGVPAGATPGRSNHTARVLSTAMLYLNSPPILPKYCGQVNPNLNDHHSDAMDNSRTVWI